MVEARRIFAFEQREYGRVNRNEAMELEKALAAETTIRVG